MIFRKNVLPVQVTIVSSCQLRLSCLKNTFSAEMRQVITRKKGIQDERTCSFIFIRQNIESDVQNESSNHKFAWMRTVLLQATF